MELTNFSYLMLFLSCAALLAVPLVFHLVKRFSLSLAGLNGFMLGAIGMLVTFEIIPAAISTDGSWAVLACAIGLTLPIVMERALHMATHKVHAIVLWVAVGGLGLHSSIDGLAMASSSSGGEHALALAAAVVLHRLPVGLTVWWLVEPQYGKSKAALFLFVIAAATAAGFFMHGSVIDPSQVGGLGLFQAFVAGSLIHVLIDSPPPIASTSGKWAISETAGFVLGIALVVGLFNLHGHAEAHSDLHAVGHFSDRLVDLALISAPALLLGYALAGLFTVAFPQASLRWIKRGRPLSQATKGVALGIPIPICSCGVVPVYQGLVTKGVPATAAMAFLVATPELGVESIILSFPMLGSKLAFVRIGGAVVIALLVGWLVGTYAQKRSKSQTTPPDEKTEKPLTVKEKTLQAIRFGFGEVVGDTAAWIIFGILIAAALEPHSLDGLLAVIPPGAEVAIFAIVGMPIYVCASGATPLAAGLIAAGVSPGAGLAFLLSGPATNVTTFGVLAQLHGKRIATLFALTVVGGSVVLGYLVNFYIGPVGLAPAFQHDHSGSILQWVSLAILMLVFARALLLKGPQAMVKTVLNFGGAGHSHDHHHHNDDNHDHDHSHGHHHHKTDPEKPAGCSSGSC